MKTLAVILAQILAAGCAIAMSLWGAVPWPGVAAFAILSAILVTASVRQQPPGKGTWIVACLCTVAGLGSLLPGKNLFFVDFYYAIVAGLIALAILTIEVHVGRTAEFLRRWRGLGLCWAFFGAGIWTAHAYLENLRIAFYAGLLMNLGLIVLLKSWFRLPAVAVLVANTVILLLVALPAVDFCLRPGFQFNAGFDPAKKYFRYDIGSKDPEGYAAWTLYASGEWDRAKEFFDPDPAGKLPPTPRPNTRGTFFKSPIAINSLGFRGPEIAREKGDTYRIVALGESTTFGVTLFPEDRPWPELLEQMIRERIKPCRPVEVINAGIPGFSLRYNLDRLPEHILSLKPDMIISYHGLNGFRSILAELPEINVKHPPLYQPRALKILADCEFRFKVMRFQQRQMAKLAGRKGPLPDPMQTDYAAAYRQLVNIAKTNGIQLVLGTYSMAVNGRSNPQLVDFYKGTFRAANWQIKANEIHTAIVKRTAELNPEVCLVDTQPHLDGEHDKFIDLVHLAQDGRQQVAENFFAGIRPILERHVGQAFQPAGFGDFPVARRFAGLESPANRQAGKSALQPRIKKF